MASDVDALLDAARELARDAKGEIEKLEAERTTLDEKLKRMRAMVRALLPEAVQQKKPQQPKAETVSPAQLAAVAAGITAMNQDTFSALDVHAWMKEHSLGAKSEAHTYMTFKQLRVEEIIGAAGRDVSTNRNLFRIMDRRRLSALAREANVPA